MHQGATENNVSLLLGCLPAPTECGRSVVAGLLCIPFDAEFSIYELACTAFRFLFGDSINTDIIDDYASRKDLKPAIATEYRSGLLRTHPQ